MRAKVAHRLLVAVVLTGIAAPVDVLAQAWVGPAGEGGVGVDYGFVTSDVIVEEDDDNPATQDEFEPYPIDNHNIVFSADYNVIDNLGLSLSVPYIFVRYEAQPGATFPEHGPWDDGDFHSTLQDLRFRARYQLPIEAVAFTPHIGVQIPLADYEVQGFTNAGRHLKGLLLGTSLGILLIDRIFGHATYEFGLFEKADESEFHDDYNQWRSDLNITAGYLITPGIEAHLGVDLHWTHDGLAYSQLPLDMTHPLYFSHDLIIDEDWVNIGLGASWQMTDSFSLSAEFRRALFTYNAREITSLNVGLGYNFAL